jgi:hypothetical protein
MSICNINGALLLCFSEPLLIFLFDSGVATKEAMPQVISQLLSSTISFFSHLEWYRCQVNI